MELDYNTRVSHHARMSATRSAADHCTETNDNHERVWLFGYGSLIWKADFAYIERRPASIQDWSRRFWQGSHDHRGTQDAPGRVVTLVHTPGATCSGMAYLIAPEVFTHLDHREKDGYLRLHTPMSFADGSHTQAVVYMAREDNPAFLGDAPMVEIARHIAASSGPSGSNREYLVQLARALRELGADDAHIFEIERQLLALDEAAPSTQ